MSRYTVFLPAPSFSELNRTGTRTWVASEYLIDIPNGEASQLLSQDAMDVDGETEKKQDNEAPLALLEFREPQGISSEESMVDASSFLFSQRPSQLYDGAVLREGDLDEEYAFSQAAEISKDSDAYDWSISISGPAATQNSRASQEQSGVHELPPTSSYPRHTETQDTSMDEDSSADNTRDSSDASIARLPTFRIPINRLASLKHLMQPHSLNHILQSTKVVVLAGILDLDGPDYIRIKKGVDAGLEVALLKIVIGDAEGGICKLTIWRELAEEWGGCLSRGDVVLFQDIMFSTHADGTGSCTASQNAKSTATVCYRTIPLTSEDKRLRPDLRLAAFDPAIARVAQVVRWLDQMRT